MRGGACHFPVRKCVNGIWGNDVTGYGEPLPVAKPIAARFSNPEAAATLATANVHRTEGRLPLLPHLAKQKFRTSLRPARRSSDSHRTAHAVKHGSRGRP